MLFTDTSFTNFGTVTALLRSQKDCFDKIMPKTMTKEAK
jgi:hypothetical protein